MLLAQVLPGDRFHPGYLDVIVGECLIFPAHPTFLSRFFKQKCSEADTVSAWL